MNLSRPLDDVTFAFVHCAFLDHLVRVFRDQTLSMKSQIAISRRFGSINLHAADDAPRSDHPEVVLVSTRKRGGKYVGLSDVGPMWHSDIAYKERTALWSMLYAIEVLDHSVS